MVDLQAADDDVTFVASDGAVTRRERRRQSDYRDEVLRLPAGHRPPGGGRPARVLGSLLPAEDRRHNFLSAEAADYAAGRVDVVRAEGGQLEQARLFTNMLSSMPLCFSVFGHLRAHPVAAAALLSELLGRDVVGFDRVDVGGRVVDGIECEWAPRPADHLADGTAFDAVAAARLADGRSLLVAVECKYVDSFSRDPSDVDKDRKYQGFCDDFGFGPGAFDRLKGAATKQLLRNVLLTESVRRGGRPGRPTFDEAVTIVFARDDDEAARRAVDLLDVEVADVRTDVRFVGHGELATAADAVPTLAPWSSDLRRRYVGQT